MENELLQKVKDDYARKQGGIHETWDRFISDTPISRREDHYDAIAEAYHAAKSEQKQHLVELMKMDEFNELLSIAVEANNHAKRIVNKELILVDDKPKHWDKINKRAEMLSKYADKSAPKIVQSEVKQLSECFDLGEIRAKQITSSMRKLPLVEFVNYLNLKASQYATNRAKKALEKVLSMLRENQAASSQLIPEDAARSAQDIIDETFADLIEIVQAFKP